jgi:hypothetical protein
LKDKMTTTASHPALSHPEGFAERLRHLTAEYLFAVVLLIARIFQFRRNPRPRMFFRFFLGVAGAAMVVLPLGLGAGFVPAIAGLVMFICAILLPPAKPGVNANDIAHKLGAVAIVSGGRYQRGSSPSVSVQLFVGSEHICALDWHLQPILEIPVGKISAAGAEQSKESWSLRITWANHTAEFSYRGIFAGRFARAAETAIRGVMPPALPALPQRRAAGA